MKRVEMSQKKWIASMVGCAMVGSAMGSVGLSFADNLRSTSNILNNGVVVPYDGYLMLDSAPVSAQNQKLKFALFEAPSGGTAQWVEEHTVSVVNGKFSVALGTGTKLSSSPVNATFSDVILDAQKLYISVSVIDAGGAITDLSGRQEIMPAPYAAWSARSADFKAEGDLTVEGVTRPQNGIVMRGDTSISGVDQIIGHNDLRLSGSPTSGTNNLYVSSTGDVTVGKALNVKGTSSFESTVTALGQITAQGTVTASDFDGAYTPRYVPWSNYGLGSGGAALYNDNGTYKALMVVGNNSAGGVREVKVYDNLTVDDDLTVNKNVSIGNDTVINGDLNVLGSLKGGVKYTSEYSQEANGYRDMISTSQGICFLTRVVWDHAWEDIHTLGCTVGVSGSVWRLTNNEPTGGAHPNRGDVSCRARCIVGPTPQ